MTRLSTLAIALAATSPISLTLGQAVAPPPAPAAPAQPAPRQQSAIASTAAQQLARAALIDFRTHNNPGPADARYNARILRDAALLDPTNSIILRLAIDAATLSGNQQSALELCRLLVAQNPGDTEAQFDLINARLAMCHTVEDRFVVLDSFLGPRGDSIDPAIRSRLAVTSALLRRERGDDAGFARDLTTATTLDSSNYAAAALALDYYSSRVKDPQGKFVLLTSTLLASPMDASIHAALARELAEAGASEQALRFYENAKLLANRTGNPLPLDGTQEGHQIQLWKARGPETVIKPLNDAIEGGRRQAQIDLDVANATSKPTEDLPLPASIRLPLALERIRVAAAFSAGDRSTLDRSLTDLQATLNAMPDAEPAKVGFEIEAAYIRALSNSGDISADISRLRNKLGAKPEAIARLEAWVKHRRGSSAAARTAFEAMKDDPLAKLALAAIEVESAPATGTPQAAALNERLAALANDNGSSPISAWATTVYKARNEGKAPPLSPRAEKFTAMGAGIPSWLDDLAKEPGRLIAIRIEPANSRGLSPLEPTLLNVRVSNNTPVPIAVGPGLTLDNRMLVSTIVEVGGVIAPDIGGTEVASLNGRVRLQPREEAEFTIWADPGFGGWAVQNAITRAARLRFSVIQGFIIDNMPKPGPFGNSIEAGPVRRGSLPLSDPVRLCGEISTLQEDEFAVAILHARLQLLARDKPLSDENAKSLVKAVSERYRRATPAERIIMLTLMPTPHMVETVTDFSTTVGEVDETNPAVARAVLLTRVDGPASPLLNKFRRSSDVGVQEAVRNIEERLAAGKPLFSLAAAATTPKPRPKSPEPAPPSAPPSAPAPPAVPATPPAPDAPGSSPFGLPSTPDPKPAAPASSAPPVAPTPK